MALTPIPRRKGVDPHDLPWPQQVPIAVGVLALGVGVVVALERHEFTHPNIGLPVICVIILPWVLDMIEWPGRILRDRRMELPLFTMWSVVVMAGVGWLVVAYPVSNDFAPFILTVLVGEMASTAGPRFGAVVGLASIGMVLSYAVAFRFDGFYIWGFAFAIAWMGGTAFLRQVENSYFVQQAQEQLAEHAAEEERHRLAREIHDLIAHSLAVTMLQLSGARLALAAGDTDDALAALADAEAAGRAAMAEIHRTVGLLGSPGQGLLDSPTPCASDIPTLVSSFSKAGLAVDLDLDGDLSGVPMATGLAAYRVVQESLSNAVKHAPGEPVRLRVGVTRKEIIVNVVNPVGAGAPASGSAGGHGLKGMAERAELLGGSVAAGNGGGTWKVNATIPWEETPRGSGSAC